MMDVEHATKAEGEDTNEAATTGRYQLRLTGEGLTLERTLAEAEALQVVAVVLGASNVPELTGHRTEAEPDQRVSGPLRRRPSLREYFDSVEPKRNPDKILAVASYVQRIEGEQLFAPQDLKRRFRDAGEPLPGNWGRDFRWTIQNGWIAEDRGSGGYYVTKKGEDAVTQKFSAEIKKATSVKQRRRKARSDKA